MSTPLVESGRARVLQIYIYRPLTGRLVGQFAIKALGRMAAQIPLQGLGLCGSSATESVEGATRIAVRPVWSRGIHRVLGSGYHVRQRLRGWDGCRRCFEIGRGKGSKTCL